MGKGTVSSDSHVDVKLTNGTLTSDRLRINGGGEVIRFEGNVVMHLDNMNMGGTPDPSATASAARRNHTRTCADAGPSSKARSSSSKSANSK